MQYRNLYALLALSLVGLIGPARQAGAQTFGVELHNTLMPASGAMGGASIARPQDVQSALANPATLTQFQGTQFGFGGAWAEPTMTIDNDADLQLIGVEPYEDKSGRPGSVIGNIAVTQDFSALGMPVTVGLGLLTTTGLGIDYRESPESQGTSAELVGLSTVSGVGVQVTERLSLGGAVFLTAATVDGPFAGASASVPAYALRASLGATYELTPHTTLGGYWWTRQSFQFDDAVLPPGPFAPQDINLDLPETFGFGLANDRLLGGRLLIAVDVLYKRWDNADFFESIWNDQWVFQVGTQYTVRQGVRLRLGYAYTEDISRDPPGLSVGGVIPPDALPGVQYVQAQFPAINQHRLTGGVGLQDVLPGVDLDLLAGAMFRNEHAFGLTTASAQSYWVGMGLTWRFGRGACCQSLVPNHW